MMASRLQKLKDCKELFRAMDENDHFALKNKITEANLPNSVIEKAILRQKELQKAYAQYLKDMRVKRGMSAYMQRYEKGDKRWEIDLVRQEKGFRHGFTWSCRL